MKSQKKGLPEQLERDKAFFDWLDKGYTIQKDLKSLPDWLNTDNYLPTKQFKLSDWIYHLAIRKEIQPYVSDGPQRTKDEPPIKFLNALLTNPLEPDFSLYPGLKETIDEEYKIRNTGVFKTSNPEFAGFAFNTLLPDKLLIECFKCELSLQRKSVTTQPLRKKRIDYDQWAKLNILTLVDLRIWEEIERKYLSWELVAQIIDPTGTLEISVARKQITYFFNEIYYLGGSFDFLIAQAYLEEEL